MSRFLDWLFGLFATERKFLKKKNPVNTSHIDFSFYVSFVNDKYPDIAEYLSGRECWIVWLFVTKCGNFQGSLTPKYISFQYLRTFYPNIRVPSINDANTGYTSKSLNSLHQKGILEYDWSRLDKRRYKLYRLKKKFFSAKYEQSDRVYKGQL